jgi:hypothetical protein
VTYVSLVPFKGLDKLRGSRVLLGFDCIFDDTKNLDAVATVFERFFDAYPHRFLDTTAIRPVSPRSRGLVRHRVEQALRKAYEIKLFDAEPANGYDWYGRTHMGLILNLRGNDPDEIDPPAWSLQSLYLPKADEPERLLGWALEVGRTMTVRFGVGGWALAPSFGHGPVGDEDVGARLAHPGLCEWHSDLDVWRAKHGIRDTNWLTLVSNDILQRVGGISALRPKLSSQVVLHEVRDGWLFQAGEEPLIGGKGYEEDDFSVYAEVARALAPCRDRVVGWPDETWRWMARFDAVRPPTTDVVELEVPTPLGAEALRSEAAFAQVWRDFQAMGDEAAIAHGIHPTLLESVHDALVAELADDPTRRRAFEEALARAAENPLPTPKKKKPKKKGARKAP